MVGLMVDWKPPPRPRWVERLNRHADHVGAPHALVTLDPEELIAVAQSQTGLHDFGEPGEFGDATGADGAGWRDHYEAFMDALSRECPLHVAGRIMTRTELLRALCNRLELVDLWRRRPEILERRVGAPLVVIGPARSGTSILHELLALDPGYAVPAAWKVLRPAAAAEGDPASVAAARRDADAVMSFWHDVQPEYEAMHVNGGDLPIECIFVTLPTFLSDNWAGTHTVPSYSLRVALADHGPAYQWHRHTLQTLAGRESAPRWVLKAPSHLATLRELFAVYPDARVIQLHRDPARTIPSMLSLMGTLRWMRTDAVDMVPFVEPTVAGVALLQRRAIADRADGRIPDDHFFDLHYTDLLNDAAGAISAAYQHFGWTVPAGLTGAVRDYLDRKPRGSRGRHRYSPEAFGLTSATIRAEFEAYIERFAVPFEPDDDDG